MKIVNKTSFEYGAPSGDNEYREPLGVISAFYFTRKYPLRGYILGSGAPGTPGVNPKTYGTTFISDIL